MNGFAVTLREYGAQWVSGWNAFWFSARDPRLLSLIRIATGAMLLYTHAVWTLELPAFLGPDGMLPPSYAGDAHVGAPMVWSHLNWFESVPALYVVHAAALVVFALFTIGLWTPAMGALAFLLTVSYAHRATGTTFGLDQINGFLVLYLAVGPAGAAFSVDRWLAQRRNGNLQPPAPNVPANISIRLIQVHLCIVYLFAGMGKLLGETWWNGEALWGALASYDYQTIDLTWLAAHMYLINLLTLVTLVWEVSYVFLIWHPLTRPLWLLGALLTHLGIGMCMGMMTFGLIMIVANAAFIPDSWLMRIVPSRNSPDS